MLEELTEAPWGKQAVFRDLYGNLFDLPERRRWMNTMAISVPVLFRRMTAQQALPPGSPQVKRKPLLQVTEKHPGVL
jgi:hypothetical protein